MNQQREYFFTKCISEASTESVMRIIDGIFSGEKKIRLNWSETEEIEPAGVALLSLLYDYACERGVKITSVFTKKALKKIPIIQKLQQLAETKLSPASELNFDDDDMQLFCLENCFPEGLREYQTDPFEQADLNQLLQELVLNAIDHSTSERFYVYQGIYNQQLHLGILDLGVGIAAKLKNYLNLNNDIEYIEASLEKGSTSRRLRDGGVGLFRVAQTIKRLSGKLVILSGDGQLRRYYANRRVDRKSTKYRVPGTWLFISLPIKK